MAIDTGMAIDSARVDKWRGAPRMSSGSAASSPSEVVVP